MNNRIEITDWSICRLKRRAKDIQHCLNIPRHQALEQIAKIAQYSNWNLLKASKRANRNQHYARADFSEFYNFRRLFNLDVDHFWAEDRIDKSLNLPDIVQHDFPSELNKFSNLNSWRTLWNEHSELYDGECFVPPMMPLECFQGNNKYLRLYQDWPINTLPRHSSIYCGGVAYNNENEIIGHTHYYLWGFTGNRRSVEFSCYIKIGDHLLTFWFDLRQYMNKPSTGPRVTISAWADRENEGEYQRSLNSLHNYPFREVDSSMADYLGW